MLYRILADVTVVLHFAYVLFVMLGLLITLVGWIRGWEWIRNRWFRGVHLTMILIVVAEAWAGITCPLTDLENWFRELAGQQAYQGDFVANFVHDIMFIDAPPWFFTMAYSLFAAAVITTWVFIPPRLRSVQASTEPNSDQ